MNQILWPGDRPVTLIVEDKGDGRELGRVTIEVDAFAHVRVTVAGVTFDCEAAA